MTIEVGTTIKWIHPDNGEEYFLPVEEASHHGGGNWTITLKDGRDFELWEYEVCSGEPFEILPEQINPEGSDQDGLLR